MALKQSAQRCVIETPAHHLHDLGLEEEEEGGYFKVHMIVLTIHGLEEEGSCPAKVKWPDVKPSGLLHNIENFKIEIHTFITNTDTELNKIHTDIKKNQSLF